MRRRFFAVRAVLGLALIAAAVAAAVFFADHPGQVGIVWLGRQADTSVAVLAGAVAALLATVVPLALVTAALRRLPRNLRRRRAARRRRVGEAALTRGIVALAAGQAAEARRAASRAEALLEGAPVALLLAAEAAQRLGDAADAQRAYSALLERPETEFLGLRGLIGQLLCAGDDDAALRLAVRARRLRPDAAWLADSLLALQARAGDWAAARDTLVEAGRRGALPREQARHHQGVALFELSRAAERRGALREAASLAARGQALAPDLATPACHHARLLLELGRRRAAARAIERAWRTAPHPDLARLYLEIDGDAPPLGRAQALQRLAGHNPDALESHLAIADAALAARLWGEARRHLSLAVDMPEPPSRRLCLLMARLEESDGGNTAMARQWLDRALAAPADAAYVCGRCAAISREWTPLCPNCGAFDTLAWRAATAAERTPAITAAALAPLPLIAPPSGLAAAPQSDK